MNKIENQTIKIGFLYPGYAAEDDYPLLANMIKQQVKAEVIHTEFDEDAHRVDALLEMGSSKRLLDGAKKLKSQEINAVLWTCTSGSFVYGLDGAKRQAEELGNALGVPASTTALSFVDACHAIGAKKVAIAATYPEDVANRFKMFLLSAGIEVLQLSSQGIITAAEVGTLQKDQVLKIAAENDHPEADALLIPDTALHSAAWIEELEAVVEKPVLTANQVSFWKGLCLAGGFQKQKGLGTLYNV